MQHKPPNGWSCENYLHVLNFDITLDLWQTILRMTRQKQTMLKSVKIPTGKRKP